LQSNNIEAGKDLLRSLVDRHASFLMPDIPVSEGKLLTVRQQLGEVDGVAALIANLEKKHIRQGMVLLLYTAEQHGEDSLPRVKFKFRKVKTSELVETAEGVALVGEEFADHNKGWALVLVDGERCSTQGLVTQCRFYEQYTTQEALLAAAKSHSNRKMKIDVNF